MKTTTNNNTLSNENTIFTLSFDTNGKADVSGRDLTDRNNMPACFNRNYRSYKKAWKALTEQFNNETSMYEAQKVLRENGLKMHSYCQMD